MPVSSTLHEWQLDPYKHLQNFSLLTSRPRYLNYFKSIFLGGCFQNSPTHHCYLQNATSWFFFSCQMAAIFFCQMAAIPVQLPKPEATRIITMPTPCYSYKITHQTLWTLLCVSLLNLSPSLGLPSCFLQIIFYTASGDLLYWKYNHTIPLLKILQQAPIT